MKNRLFILIALMLTLSATAVEAKKKKKSFAEEKGVASINIETAEAHVGFLASDALRGRESGTPEGYIAGEYLISVLKQMGATPLFGKEFAQPFEAYSSERRNAGFTVNNEAIEKLKQRPHRVAKMRNILARIEGKNPEEIVVVGAHYDHLGYDPMLVGDKIFNGADDNASGVQAVLQILRAFIVNGEKPERTVIFALWDGEERGLLGSTYFVNNFADMKKVKGYMNFDMIGRNNMEERPQHFNLLYMTKDSVFADWLKKDIENHALRLDPNFVTSEDFSGGSDQVPFFKAGAKIVWYQTGAQPDFHMPTDEASLINWDKMVEITKAAYLCLWKMANSTF